MRRLVTLLALLTLSGCVAPGAHPATGGAHAGALDALHASDASATTDAPDGARTFVFAHATTAHRQSPGARGGTDALYEGEREVFNTSFDLDAALVGWVDVNFTYDATRDTLTAAFYDGDGHLQCRVDDPHLPRCSAPVVGAAGVHEARLVVRADDVDATGSPFQANVTLHPVGDGSIAHGDPSAGTDPAIKFRISDTKRRGGEMNVGVLADGAIFMQTSIETMRSKDDGTTWTDVSPPTAQALGSCDPMLRADPWSGRVWTAQLNCLTPAVESVLSWTTDEGATWVVNPMTGPVPQQDHEKLAVGPSPIPMAPDPALYYAHTTPGAAIDRGTNPSFVSRSLDGGATFTSAPVTGLTDNVVADTVGAIEADRGSTVYVPVSQCVDSYYGASRVGVAVSNDYGTTFRYHVVASMKNSCSTTSDPGVGIDTQGVAYMAFIADGAVEYVVSRDHGATWSAPIRVSPTTQPMASHVDIVAGDAGKIAIAYRATSDSAREPSLVDGWAAWHMYVAFVEDAASTAPHMRVALVTPADDPVMRGCIWQYGGSNPCRRLFDFFDIAVGPDGRVYVAYPDACPGICPTPADSRAVTADVAILEDGPRLFASQAPWAHQGRG